MVNMLNILFSNDLDVDRSFEINKSMPFKVRKKRHRRFLVLSKGFLPYICYYKTLTKFLGMTLALILRRGLYRVVFSYIILFYR